jgi:hypothetical protein
MNKETLIEYINQGLSTWKIAEELNTTQPNIRYWLKKYNLQTQRITNQLNSNRLCLTCKIIQSQDNFYKRGKKFMSHCKTCYQDKYTKIRKNNKQKGVEYLGGKCIKCGYNKCNSALEFHHTDPTQKDKDYSNYKTSFNKLKIELDKCVLLCSNCHREHHSS